MEEREAKFVLGSINDADAALRLLSTHATLHAQAEIRQRDVYLDDRKQTLKAAGWACRLREKHADSPAATWSLELKSLDGGGAAVQVREEIEQPLFATLEVPFAPVELDEGDVRETLARLGAGRLDRLFNIANQRRRYRAVTVGGTELEVCVDRAAVEGNGRRVLEQFCELEIELCAGSERDLELIAQRFADAGYRTSRLSKFDRGAWAAGISRPSKLPQLHAADSSAELLRGQLSRWLARVAHFGLVAQEGADPRGIHQLRTNIRRIRAALKGAAPELGDAGLHLSSALGELARGVGPARDLDVFSAGMALRMGEMSAVDPRARELLLARLNAGQVPAREAASRALAGLPTVLGEASRLIDHGFVGDWPTIGEFARRYVIKRWRQLRKAGRSLQADSPDSELHALRLRAKRLRYALELVRPAYGREAKDMAVHVRALQESFGAHQDACVAINVLRSVGNEMPADGASRDALILLGRMLEDQYTLSDSTRLTALEDWRTYERKVRKRDILGLLNGP